ncbi:MAG: hypothetical protein HKL89_06295 [Candidatus Dormibacteraeota bacterium]|nr:hypothetical protein [Candidatus Dormibacteraeota bacterium]
MSWGRLRKTMGSRPEPAAAETVARAAVGMSAMGQSTISWRLGSGTEMGWGKWRRLGMATLAQGRLRIASGRGATWPLGSRA